MLESFYYRHSLIQTCKEIRYQMPDVEILPDHKWSVFVAQVDGSVYADIAKRNNVHFTLHYLEKSYWQFYTAQRTNFSFWSVRLGLRRQVNPISRFMRALLRVATPVSKYNLHLCAPKFFVERE